MKRINLLIPFFALCLSWVSAQAQELEMVVTPEALFYADPDLDITDEVTALLDLAASKSEE